MFQFQIHLKNQQEVHSTNISSSKTKHVSHAIY